MKHRIRPFLAGVCTTLICLSLGLTALAASGTVSFNTVGVSVRGALISQPGEHFTLSNGVQVPSVITYTDEQGGGTTYLPARRIAELMEVEIAWDAPSGSVTIGGSGPVALPTPAPVPSPTPEPTPAPQVTATVYVTRTGEKYHRAGCRYLSKSQISIGLTDAKSQGYTPCSVCRP